MDHKKYRYHHMGIPTTKKLEDATYVADHDVYVTDFANNEFHIEWIQLGENCTLPEVVQKIPHVAFEVQDIHEAIKGQNVVMDIHSPKEDLLVAFVLVNDAPVEFLQFGK